MRETVISNITATDTCSDCGENYQVKTVQTEHSSETEFPIIPSVITERSCKCRPSQYSD